MSCLGQRQVLWLSVLFRSEASPLNKCLVLGWDKNNCDSSKTYSETLDFLIDNIVVVCDGCVFKQTVRIAVGINWVPPFLVDLFILSKAEIQGLLQRKQKEISLIRYFQFPIFKWYPMFEKCAVWWFPGSYISHWDWNWGYQTFLCLLHTLIFTYKFTMLTDVDTNCTTNFPNETSH